MNDEANLSIVVALARWLALIGVLVWALTSKDGDGKGTETSQTTNGGSNNKNNGGYIEVPRGDSNGNSGDDSYDSYGDSYDFDGLLIRVERGVGRLDAADRVRPVDCVTGIIPDGACRLRYDARSI